jgi:hypothetical protein
MWQMKDHVRPVLVRLIPTLCVLFSALFQECISYFTVNILFLQNSTVIKHNVRVNVL